MIHAARIHAHGAPGGFPRPKENADAQRPHVQIHNAQVGHQEGDQVHFRGKSPLLKMANSMSRWNSNKQAPLTKWYSSWWKKRTDRYNNGLNVLSFGLTANRGYGVYRLFRLFG